jgi:hypothetical protein
VTAPGWRRAALLCLATAPLFTGCIFDAYAPPSECVGLEVGDVLEITLGEPSADFSEIPCDPAFGLVPGAVISTTVTQLAGTGCTAVGPMSLDSGFRGPASAA